MNKKTSLNSFFDKIGSNSKYFSDAGSVSISAPSTFC